MPEKTIDERAVIELRTRGLSYREIAAELGTTKEKILNITEKLQDKVRKGGCNC
jgi:transcriptional regulator